MTEVHKGQCLCGAVTFKIAAEPMRMAACHCKDCQKRTGSAFSMGMVYPISSLSVTGELSRWERTSDEGNVNTRYSCSDCGNIIYGVGSITPDLIKLQPGTLDDTSAVQVDAHIWTRNAQTWVVFPENALKYETQPDNLIEVFEAVIKGRTSGDC